MTVGFSRLKKVSFFGFVSLALLAVFVYRCYFLYSTAPLSPWGLDEVRWLSGAYFYKLYFLDRDFRNEDWSSIISYDHPHMTHYVLGASLHLFNHKVVNSSGGLMSWFNSTDSMYVRDPLIRLVNQSNLSEDRRLLEFVDKEVIGSLRDRRTTPIAQDDIELGKRTMFFFAAASAVLLMLVCFVFLRRFLAGALAGLIFLGNSMTIPLFQQVYNESLCCFFVLLSLISLLALFEVIGGLKRRGKPEFNASGGSSRKVVFLSAATGIFLSMGLSTKFTTAYMVLTVVLAFILNVVCLFRYNRKYSPSWGGVLLRLGLLALSLAVAFALFVLLHPGLYNDPVGNSIRLVEIRKLTMDAISRTNYPPVTSLWHRLGLLYSKGVLMGYDLPDVDAFVFMAAFLMGLWYLMLNSFKELSSGLPGKYTVLVLWGAAVFAVNGMYLNVDWNRYFVYFAMFSSVAVALGAELLLRSFVREDAFKA